MKIISWNLNHRTLEKPIPATVIDSLQHLDADIVVLNEYVDGPSRAEFKDNLNGIGYGHLAVSTHYPKHNQVLIASRHAITEGDLEAPNLTLPAKSNFLHVKLADQTLEVVGVRPPAYKTKRETEAYWKQLAEIIHGSSSRPIIFLGDLNADPDNKKSTGGKALKILDVTDKWFIPRPEGEWSYISSDGKRSSRIDHAICSTSLDNVMAKYVYKINSITLAGPKVTGPISDHAALMVLIN